jgi:hypothetical protein
MSRAVAYTQLNMNCREQLLDLEMRLVVDLMPWQKSVLVVLRRGSGIDCIGFCQDVKSKADYSPTAIMHGIQRNLARIYVHR